jgi:excisionase family DNA binding protein
MALVVIETSDLEIIIQQAVERAFAKQSMHVVAESSIEGLIVAQQAANILNISLSTLHTYKKQGIIPFHRIGRRVYFKESELLASLKKVN